MSENILEMRNITKLFPGVRALDDVNLQVKKGTIHALVGENGAGKSTLMNVLSGIYPYGSYTGDIVYEGEVCKFAKITDSEQKGIVIIHQELALVPYMTIGENMFLGNEQGKSFSIDWDGTYEKADKYLKIVGLADLFGVTTDYLLRQDGGRTAAAQPRNNGGRSGTGRRESRDFIDRMGYLAKTKGYLLGWVLVVWGALDLLVLLLMGMGVLGMLTMW